MCITTVTTKQVIINNKYWFWPVFVAALWSHPEELPELPHQTQDRNNFSCRYYYGNHYTWYSFFTWRETIFHIIMWNFDYIVVSSLQNYCIIDWLTQYCQHVMEQVLKVLSTTAVNFKAAWQNSQEAMGSKETNSSESEKNFETHFFKSL